MLFAQTFRITSINKGEPARVTIQYESTVTNQFILFRGDNVTNIITPVATNTASLGFGQFTTASTDSTAFFRVQEQLSDPGTAPLTRFTSSPAHGEAGVAVTRETIVRFNQPLATDAMIRSNELYAVSGGRRILSRVELSSDRLTATLFYLENLPASSRVRVTFDGNNVRDFLGRIVDADNDGIQGGIGMIDFDTLSITPVAQTAVIGRVFASELVPGKNGESINRPLQNVTITVDGAEETLRATTDAQGNFKLQPAPAGRFFVHIDGRTAVGSEWPNGAYYPVVGKAWDAAAGRTDNLAGGNGEVYLPLIQADALQPVSASEDTGITFPPSVISSNPALAGVSITVSANSLFSDSGTRGGRVGIAPVAPDRLPGPLPTGLQFPLVITVQTDGGLNFDNPAAVRFPNLPDPETGTTLRPGAKSALWSFNHDVGEWEIVGSMTVTADGAFIESDPGVGIRQPGWHGTQPGSVGIGSGGGCQSVHCGDLGPQQDVFNQTVLEALGGASFANELMESGDTEDVDLDSSILAFETFLRAYDRMNRVCASCGVVAVDADSFEGRTILTEQAPIVMSLHTLALKRRRGQWTPNDRTEFSKHAGNLRKSRDSIRDLIRRRNAKRNQLTFSQRAVSRPKTYFVSAGGRVQRGTTDSQGKFQIPLGNSSGSVFVSVFDPETGRSASTSFLDVPTAGATFQFPDYVLDQLPESIIGPEGIDIDMDGLSEAGEVTIGTDPIDADSDDDGIRDGIEMQNGTNPLNNLAVATGVVASAPTLGTAVDVCAINDMAIIADTEAGVAVFNVFAGLNPTRVAQVDTPGTALAVACSGNLIAVADGTAGLHVIDISEPADAQIVRTTGTQALGGGSAQAVAAAADLAFVGTTGGFVNMVQLTTGIVLQQVDLKGRVEDLSLEGTTLYAYGNSRIHVLPFAKGGLEPAGSIECPAPAGVNTANGRGRLFVGGGIAYAVHTKGYNTFDVSDPQKPSRIATGDTTQLGWKQIVINGSGLGLAAVSPNLSFDGPHNISLYDTTDPARTDAFITQFETPGTARAISIYNGLAYVADHRNGLQVVNYLPYDNKGQPPSGTLSTSSTNGQISAGSFILLSASVRDDVQVRNVEFFVDGQRIAIDGNFPFETVYRVPTNRLGGQLTFTANIFDTGGNRGSVSNAPITVTPDDESPSITIDSPKAGNVSYQFDDISIQVTAIDNAGIDSISFLLNGEPLPVRRVSFSGWLIEADLPFGTNTLEAIATDLAGLVTVSQPVSIVRQRQTLSREITVFNRAAPESRDAISREISVFNLRPTEKPDAISREISIFNRAVGENRDAISREVSINIQPTLAPQALTLPQTSNQRLAQP